MKRTIGRSEIVNLTINESDGVYMYLNHLLLSLLKDKELISTADEQELKSLHNDLSTSGWPILIEMKNVNSPSRAKEFLSVAEGLQERIRKLEIVESLESERYRQQIYETQEKIEQLKVCIVNRTTEVDLANVVVHCLYDSCRMASLGSFTDSLLECSDEYQFNPNLETFEKLMEKVREISASIKASGRNDLSVLMSTINRLEAYRMLNNIDSEFPSDFL